ncbi:MAG: hypothetical protein ACFCU8_09315 [Thermosynechococcaceae cyanobacterium]
MTNVSFSKKLVELGEVTPVIVTIAVLRQTPTEIAERTAIEFQDGFDDLDYLVFSRLQLPSGEPTKLVYHQNSPQPGTEVCVVPEEPDSESVIVEVMRQLQLSASELLWMHP